MKLLDCWRNLCFFGQKIDSSRDLYFFGEHRRNLRLVLGWVSSSNPSSGSSSILIVFFTRSVLSKHCIDIEFRTTCRAALVRISDEGQIVGQMVVPQPSSSLSLYTGIGSVLSVRCFFDWTSSPNARIHSKFYF